MSNDLRAELVRHYLEAAQAAAAARDWTAVADLVDDVLVLDANDADALTLRMLAERHVGRGERGSERRHETVLFADLVGSTALANRVDIERVRRLILAYEQACTPVLTALGGHVHRFVGDGILASFGYPTSHEDDAVRAVHAALDLVQAVSRVSTAESAADGPLEVRVGVATGVLVHGDRGGGDWRLEGDLFGPAVNLAARLHELAAPGQIVVADTTAALVNGQFELVALGGMPLKGFEQPVVVHLVTRRAMSPRSASARPPSLFIGREREMGRLRDGWVTVTADAEGPSGSAPAAFWMTGDPGVGKSRLLEEFLAATDEPGRSVVELHCSAYRAASPLYPVRVAVERYCRIDPSDDDGVRLEKIVGALKDRGLDADAILPVLAPVLDLDAGDRVAAPELTPLQLREMALAVLYQWVTAIAADHAAVLVVEDAHWADPTTRDLLQRILLAPPPGLMTLVTSRTSPTWLPQVQCEMVALQPLGQGDTRALASAVTSGAFPPDEVEEIAERSDGIPLFVEQLADSLADTAAGLASSGSRRRRPIPASLTELLQARLDASGPSKPVAQIAAVVGREFEPELVEVVVGWLQEQGLLVAFDRPVSAHIERLVDSRLIEPSPEGGKRLRFHHALVGQAAYESQLIEERPARHEAVARSMLATESTGRTADRAVVARHFDEAGCAAEAISSYLDASARGHSVGAFAEAIEQLSRARELLASVPDGDRSALELAICLGRGLALASTGGYAAPGVVADFQRAADLCHLLRDAQAAAAGVLRALLGLWGYYCAVGDIDRCASTISAFDDQLSRATLAGGRGSVHACRGVERFIAGDLLAAREQLSMACDLLQDERVDPASWPLPNDPLAAALAYLSNLELLCGNEAAALAAIEAGLAQSGGLEFPLGPFSLAFVRMYESWVHRMRGSFDEATEAAREIVRIGERHGYFDWQMTGRIHLAAAEAAAAPTAAALGEMGDAIAAWRSLGGEVLLPGLIVERGWGYVRLGELGSAAACLADAEVILEKGQRLATAEALRLRAELAARTGGSEPEAVAKMLRASLRYAADQGARLFVLRSGASYRRLVGDDALDDDLQRSFAGAIEAFGRGSAVVRREFGDPDAHDLISSSYR